MRAVVQRVSRAAVRVDDAVIGSIERGFLVLLGAEAGDTDADLEYLVEKVVGLRVFADAEGKMNLALADVAGGVLVVSQFTLLGDCRKGRRPSFVHALEPAQARAYYERFAAAIAARGRRGATGSVGAHMAVELVNDGPVTLLLDSKKAF
jgi:D-tyrosyl-tRNA(Tyr) deacylase